MASGAEDPDSAPSTHSLLYISRGLNILFGSSQAPGINMVHMHICR